MIKDIPIQTVTNADGSKSLVRAKTAAAAISFKRRQIFVSAAKATQDELIDLIAAGVKIEVAE